MDFMGKAAVSGVPYRMWQRPGGNISGYLYAWVKGYLRERFEERALDRERVSFEELERLQVL
jgi:hypothetical protein